MDHVVHLFFMNEHKIVITDLKTGQPAVYIPVHCSLCASKPEKYSWQILSVCEISGFDSEESALEGAWNAVNSIVQLLGFLGIPPSTDLVKELLRFAVVKASL